MSGSKCHTGGLSSPITGSLRLIKPVYLILSFLPKAIFGCFEIAGLTQDFIPVLLCVMLKLSLILLLSDLVRRGQFHSVPLQGSREGKKYVCATGCRTPESNWRAQMVNCSVVFLLYYVWCLCYSSSNTPLMLQQERLRCQHLYQGVDCTVFVFLNDHRTRAGHQEGAASHIAAATSLSTSCLQWGQNKQEKFPL